MAMGHMLKLMAFSPYQLLGIVDSGDNRVPPNGWVQPRKTMSWAMAAPVEPTPITTTC